MNIIDVTNNLINVQNRIIAASAAADRGPDEVKLIAVSKNHGNDKVIQALAGGQRRFGESRVQEAEMKWSPLRERFPNLVLHMIGPLQTNKAKAAVALFNVIETLDRPKLAYALAHEMKLAGKRPECFIELNLGEESQKAGIAPNFLPDFLSLCRDQLSLPVVGLMCIPPAQEEPSPYFALLHKLAKRHGLTHVSMGMSKDYETAVTFGATFVRVGSSIFGPRFP